MVAKHDHTLHLGGIPARPLGGVLDRGHAAPGCLLGEEGVQDHLVEAAATQLQGVGAEGDQAQGQLLVHRRQVEHR